MNDFNPDILSDFLETHAITFNYSVKIKRWIDKVIMACLNVKKVNYEKVVWKFGICKNIYISFYFASYA